MDDNCIPSARAGATTEPKPTPVISVGETKKVMIAEKTVRINSVIKNNAHEAPQAPLETQLDCSLGRPLADGRPCRAIQTNICPTIWAGNPNELIITDQLINVTLHCNNEVVEKLGEDKCSNENIEALLGKHLVDLDWSGAKCVERKLTAFKLQLEEKLPLLLSNVLSLIFDNTDRRKLMHLVRQAFKDFGMQLKMLKISSLTFIFQHTSEEKGADWMLSSEKAKGRLIGILYQFLPEWVRLYARWEIFRYVPTDSDFAPACDKFPVLTWCMPDPAYSGMRSIESLDLEEMVQAAEEHLTQKVNTFVTQLTSVFETWKRSFEQHFQKQEQLQGGQQHQSHQVQELVEEPLGTERHTHSTEDEGRGPNHDNRNLLTVKEDSSSVLQLIGERYTSRASPAEAVEGNSSVADNLKNVTVKRESAAPTAARSDSTDTSERSDQSSYLYRTLKNEYMRTSSKCAGVSGGNSGHTAVAGFVCDSGQQMPWSRIGVPQKFQKSAPDGRGPPQFKCQDDLCGSESGIGLQSMDSTASGNHSPGDGLQKAKNQLYLTEKEKFKNTSSKQAGTETTDDERPASSSECESSREAAETEAEDSASKQDESGAPVSKKKEPKTLQAEYLLNWVNVKTKASLSTDPEIQRMMRQVEHALEDEDKQPPRAKALDTVLVLDTSDSVASQGLDELKAAVHTFVDCIEENVDTLNLEENLAVVQIGQNRAQVRQHLTNDYNRIRDAIDDMTPESVVLPTGGRTPLFQALLVCLGAIEGRGGVVNVAGCHRVRPRLIFLTDGRPTDEAMETGPDMQSNVNDVKFSLVQLISEFASKKHKTTPTPIFWVPVGADPDRPFLESLAALSGGKVVDAGRVEELARYYKIQETIGCVFKMVRKHKDIYDTEKQSMSIVNALAGNLDEDEKRHIIEEVQKKQKDPEKETDEADDFDSVFEDTEFVEAGTLLPLGTRVRRGKDWKWNNQDTDGPGTVIQHRKKQDGWLHVMWDNGTHNAYRYGDGECYDVERTDEPRILDGSELIEIGVQVERGDDWKSGDEDGRGAGIVIRKRKDGKVKVRWENGHIGKYKYGADGKMELRIALKAMEMARALKRKDATAPLPEPEEEMGATGGSDPAKGSRRVWQWWDPHSNDWRTYSAASQDKLLQEYRQRTDGSCIISRNGKK